MGFVPNLSFKVENISFIVFGTLACLRMPVYVYACMKLGYVSLEHAYTYMCLRRHALGFTWPLFSKNSFI